jgi:hypothetical protein
MTLFHNFFIQCFLRLKRVPVSPRGQFRLGLLLLVLLPVWAMQVSAFELKGLKWHRAEAEFYVALTGTSATGISWNSAFIAALNEWNAKTPFNFILREEARDPCQLDGVNGVDFRPDLCGTEFGSKTLAVTFIRRTAPQLLGEPNIVESDIVVNQAEAFNVYDGRLVQFGIQGLDFRRIALHELGHVLGLDHETSKAAIMSPSIGNIDRLQADDIAGVEALYGGLANCTIMNLNYGLFSGALDANDCTVQELTAGSSDTSFIDIYRFDLFSETAIEFNMTSSGLDSVLILADTDLQFLGFDDKSSNTCNSSLSQTLPPGSYFLLANTYDVPVKEECGNQGNYQISASFSSSGPTALGASTSLTGAESNAGFRAGITGDKGLSYGNQFKPNDSLDISAEITIDPQHQGQAGFLFVAALVGEQILFLNPQGQFVDSSASPTSITSSSVKFLSSIEQIEIATALVPAALDIQNIVVDFYVGYGLISNTNEAYYHQTPLNLTIAP